MKILKQPGPIPPYGRRTQTKTGSSGQDTVWAGALDTQLDWTWSALSSVISHPSPVILRHPSSSVLCHLSSVIRLLSSVILCHPSPSVIRHPPSSSLILCYLSSSVICHPLSYVILCHPSSSVIRRPSSVILHLSSVIRHLQSSVIFRHPSSSVKHTFFYLSRGGPNWPSWHSLRKLSFFVTNTLTGAPTDL